MNSEQTEQKWLSLSDYSSKFGVSVSTLRRRIKGSQIKYKMINGKYFLANKGGGSSPVSSSVPRKETASATSTPAENHTDKRSDPHPSPTKGGDENTFQTARVLLDELKKAYMDSLQDKEKQIIQLKQQIADLKTLVMYLERENARLSE